MAIQFTDDFAHGDFTVGNGYNAVGGTPTKDTTILHAADPASLLINGANEYVRRAFTNPTAYGWHGFWYRRESDTEDALIAAMLDTTSGASQARLASGSGAGSAYTYIGGGGAQSLGFVFQVGVWYWIEMIFDTSGTTWELRVRINGTPMAAVATLTGQSATTVNRVQLATTSVTTVEHRFSMWSGGPAASETDWQAIPSGSYLFDGIDDYVSYPANIAALSLGQYLVLAWIRRGSGGHNNGRIITRGPLNSTGTDHMQLMVGSGMNGAQNGEFTIRQAAATTAGVAVSGLGLVEVGVWNLIGAHYNDALGNAQRFRLYRNGSNIAVAGGQGASGATSFLETDAYYIGGTGGNARPFGGQIGGIAVWNVAGLSDADVDAIAAAFYASGVGADVAIPRKDRLVDYVPFGVSGADDGKLGRLNPGTVSGATFSLASVPPVSYASLGDGTVKFDGSSGIKWSTIERELALVSNVGGYTAAFLVKHAILTGYQAYGYLLDGTGAGNARVGLSKHQTGANLFSDVDPTAGISNLTVALGETYLVVVRKAAGTGAITYSRKTKNGSWAHYSPGNAGDPAVLATMVELGAWEGTDRMNGWIGAAAFWDGVMTQAQVEELGTNWSSADWWNHSFGKPEFMAQLNKAAANVEDMAAHSVPSSKTVTGTTFDADELLDAWTYMTEPKKIVVLVGDKAVPVSYDNLLRDNLQALGLAVTYRSDDDADMTTQQLIDAGYGGLVIGESISAATLAAKYQDVALPLVLHEGDAIQVTAHRLASSGGSTAGSDTDFFIYDAAHPIADGPYGTLTGTVTIVTSGSAAMFAELRDTLAAGRDTVAYRAGAGLTIPNVVAFEEGATLTSGTAPKRRVFLGYRVPTAAVLNANGLALLKNAYHWAFLAEVTLPPAETQKLRPSADLATAGWSTAPLFSKVNEETADGVTITATAS